MRNSKHSATELAVTMKSQASCSLALHRPPWSLLSRCLTYLLTTQCCTKILSLSDSSRLQDDLDSINSWSSHSGLTFNISKSCLLRFYNRSTSPIDATYHLGQTDISSQDHCKDLGIIFSSDLSWSHHYNRISAKAYRQLGLIRRTFSSSVSVRAKKLLYLSLVRSQLTYCSQIWRPHLIKDILSIEKIQRRATKWLFSRLQNKTYFVGLISPDVPLWALRRLVFH